MSAPTKPTALTCAPIALTAAFGLLFSTPASAQANLVTNPGFETGDLTGYTLSGNSAHYVSVGTGIGHSGIYALDFGNNPPDATLTQDIPTVAGDSYTISYYLLSPDVSGFPAGTIADHFSSSFGGTTLFDQNNLPAVTLPAGTAYSYPPRSNSTRSQRRHRSAAHPSSLMPSTSRRSSSWMTSALPTPPPPSRSRLR